MPSPSISYGESVLSHLEKVQQLPAELQADIAKRVDSYIKLAKAAKGGGFVGPARSQRQRRAGQGNRPGGKHV
jgi:hypothetical protein